MGNFRSSAGRPALLALLAVACWSGPPAARGQWTVSEFQPSIRQGGRANTIAVSPKNDDLILVASESGGLFRSEDRGKTWRHVDGLPCFMLSSVTFLPDDPGVVLVTALDDFKQLVVTVQSEGGFARESEGGGGVWRSEDGGETWAHVTRPLALRQRISGYGISVAPDTGAVYVGHDFGVLVSTDGGKSWKHSTVFKGEATGDSDRAVYSTLALGGGVVLAGGPGGVFRSADGGTSWGARRTDKDGKPIFVRDLHAFGRSPFSRKHAYLMSGPPGNGSAKLLRTTDAGLKWAGIKSPGPGFNCNGGSCGGIGFVKAVTPAKSGAASAVDLYFGNRCDIHRLHCPRDVRTGSFDYSGKWELLNVEHCDARDIAFDHEDRPLLIGTDGGLHKRATGLGAGNLWTFVGGGKNGYNALQIAQVQGQYVGETGHLYFGTQDNGMWSSKDGGATWQGALCVEGAFISAERRVEKAADSSVTWRCGVGNVNKLSGPLFAGSKDWPNPPAGPSPESPPDPDSQFGTDQGPFIRPSIAPTLVRRKMHVQPVFEVQPFSEGLVVTFDLGDQWQQFAKFHEDVRDQPKPAAAGDDKTPAVLYQAIRSGFDKKRHLEIVHLARIVEQPKKGLVGVTFPAMNNFGGLGINPTGDVGLKPTGIATYQVFAVDPGDPDHLIAPDVLDGRMKETRDGGDNWKGMPELTDLVTDGGRLLFGRGMRPIVTVVSFCPDDPELVLVATAEGGVYLSEDNGESWERVAGSEGVTNASSVFWETANDAVISTYGRGLWRLHNEEVRPHFPGFHFELHCDGCDLVPVDPEPDPVAELRFDRGLLVFGGEVMGASVEAGILREVFVTPGSSVIFKADDARPTGVRVTRTSERAGYQGRRPLPAPPRAGQVIRGVVFGKDNRLLGVAFGGRKALMFTPKPARDKVGRPPYTKGTRPYVQLIAPRFDGAPAAAPGEAIRVMGTGFAPGSLLAVVIDGRPARRKALADARGGFEAQVRAPQEFGLHRVEIRDRRGAVVDGSTFFVSRTGEPGSADVTRYHAR